MREQEGEGGGKSEEEEDEEREKKEPTDFWFAEARNPTEIAYAADAEACNPRATAASAVACVKKIGKKTQFQREREGESGRKVSFFLSE